MGYVLGVCIGCVGGDAVCVGGRQEKKYINIKMKKHISFKKIICDLIVEVRIFFGTNTLLILFNVSR
jgi:DnaJ-class molecular chaperone